MALNLKPMDHNNYVHTLVNSRPSPCQNTLQTRFLYTHLSNIIGHELRYSQCLCGIGANSLRPGGRWHVRCHGRGWLSTWPLLCTQALLSKVLVSSVLYNIWFPYVETYPSSIWSLNDLIPAAVPKSQICRCKMFQHLSSKTTTG